MISGKSSSLASQIIAAVWIAGWSTLKFYKTPDAIGIDDVMLSGLGIAACFMPVYFSILMDKIKGK